MQMLKCKHNNNEMRWERKRWDSPGERTLSLSLSLDFYAVEKWGKERNILSEEERDEK